MLSSSFVPILPPGESEALAALGARLSGAVGGARFVHRSARSDEHGQRVDSWVAADDAELTIEWIRDDELHLRWISVLHPDRALRQSVLEQLRASMPHYSIDDLLADRPPGLSRWARLVAVALALNAGFEARVLERLTDALDDPDDEMRAHAAIAATLLLWPQLAAPLTSAAERESDEGIEEMMRAAIGAIRSQRRDDGA